VIVSIRAIRKDKNIAMKETVSLFVRKNDESSNHSFDAITMKLCNIDQMDYVSEKVEGAISFVEKSTEFFIPLGSKIDLQEELRKLSEELAYARGFLQTVEKKLSNERFVSGAPAEVVNVEKQKKADAEAKILALEGQIKTLQS
jgi:valyl-tRNA synthetase